MYRRTAVVITSALILLAYGSRRDAGLSAAEASRFPSTAELLERHKTALKAAEVSVQRTHRQLTVEREKRAAAESSPESPADGPRPRCLIGVVSRTHRIAAILWIVVNQSGVVHQLQQLYLHR